MKFIIVTTIFLITSCGSMLIPKADVQKVKQIDKLAESYMFKGTKSIGPSKKMSEALQKGQWVASLSTDKKSGEKTLMIRKVVSVDKKSITLETETYSSQSEGPEKPMVVQQTINGYPKSFAVDGNANFAQMLGSLEISSMKMKDGDKEVQDMSEISKSPLATIGIKNIAGKIELGAVSKINCETPYIKSSQCYNVPFKMGVLGFNISGSYLQNSNVPIVSYLSVDCEQNSEIVIGYGNKGQNIIIK